MRPSETRNQQHEVRAELHSRTRKTGEITAIQQGSKGEVIDQQEDEIGAPAGVSLSLPQRQHHGWRTIQHNTKIAQLLHINSVIIPVLRLSSKSSPSES